MQRVNNQVKYKDLRSKYPVFSYEAFSYSFGKNELTLRFVFSLGKKITFEPVTTIPYVDGIFEPGSEYRSADLDNLVFHIGMIELVSYWKATCSPLIVIRPAHLSQKQVQWWKKLYFHGLGEFFYLNSIEPHVEDFVRIETDPGNGPDLLNFEGTDSFLVPVGGGKDSAVTMELVREFDKEWIPFVVNSRKATRDVIARSGTNPARTLEFKRTIHPELLNLNRMGFLNGHTPFSALLAFNSLLAAYLTGKRHIALSNESSANEATIPGTSINHQYSKSFGFEKAFRSYTRDYMTPEVNYFSLLRPLSELQIAKLFSKYRHYHDVFRSCNEGSKTDTWCGNCPKCLFTNIILLPFLPGEERTRIFGKEILDDARLRTSFDELTGIAESKPFECVGTVEEVNLALAASIRGMKAGSEPELIRHYLVKHGLTDKYSDERFSLALKTMNDHHFVPGKFLDKIKELL